MRRRQFLKSAGMAGGAAALGLGARPIASLAATRGAPFDRVGRAGIALAARLVSYDGCTPTAALDLPLAGRGTARGSLGGEAWACTLRAAAVRDRPDAVELTATFRLEKGHAAAASVGLALTVGRGWAGSYLLLPGSCYAGNRFESRHIAYPPLLTEPADVGPNVPTIVSDIPRLALHGGRSRLEVLAADLATPAIGVFAPAARLGLLLVTDPASAAGPSGLSVEESDDRTRATLVVSAPGVREEVMYAAGNTRLASKDRGATFRAGDTVVLRARLHLFDCTDVPALFARAFQMRGDVRKEVQERLVMSSTLLPGPAPLPFSAAFRAREERVNARWVEAPGYFAVGARDSAYSTWQTGWCGGLQTTLPLLALGDGRSRQRALRNLEFALTEGQAPSGFFHAVHDGKEWFEDGFAAPRYKHARRWHLVRRSADALTFLAKQLLLLDSQARARGPKPDPSWGRGLERCADAFVRLWDRDKQLGQFVNIDTGNIVVGGSTSAGLAPAGLALAARYLGKPEYLQVAAATARQMFDRYVRAGLTTGAAGDALQCPESQSAAALLESFVTLHDETADPVWIDRARAAAHQLATWVVCHDGGAGGADRIGAVLSDAQNRRALPGYLLSSGEALFRLYRATGELAYLELLRDTAGNLSRHLAAPAGEGSAGADLPGDVLPVEGACDAAGLLTYAEIPGLYVQVDSGVVFAFDEVQARVREATADHLTIALANSTEADAVVRVLTETAADAAKPLPPAAVALRARTVAVAAGATATLQVPRRPSS